MKKNRKKKPNINKLYRFEVLYKPGTYMSDEKLETVITKLRDTALTCFDKLPDYQVFLGTREEMADKVIAIAWKDDVIAGFCSTVLFDIKGVGKVQHLGLTCVRPEERSNGLTHVLTHKAVKVHWLKTNPLGKLWISNCAAVLSSLVNVSLFFENIHPSPLTNGKVQKNHLKIAEAIDKYYREKIYIDKDATFDKEKFVFKGSVKNTVFQKDKNDTQFYHRKTDLNDYYKGIMNFENGDEVLQIGYASSLVAVKHVIRNLPLPKRKKPIQPAEKLSA